MKHATWTALLAVATVLALSGAPAAGAELRGPWWGVSSGAQPTALQKGVARSEVQQIGIGSEAAFVLELRASSGEVTFLGVFGTEPYASAFGLPEPTPANIQKALESPAAYGPGNVLVSGGPAGAAPLTVTSVGEDADRRGLPRVEVVPLAGEVDAKELTQGQPDGDIVLTAENLGNEPTRGPVTIEDQLPAGIHAVSIKARAGGAGRLERGRVACPEHGLAAMRVIACTYGEGEDSLPPYEQIEVRIAVVVDETPGGQVNTVTASGGAAARAVTESHPIDTVGTGRFGFDSYRLVPEEPGGSIDTQAGSHPYQLSSEVVLDTRAPDQEDRPRTFALPKDILSELPPGLLGNPTAFAQCTDAQFAARINTGSVLINECPSQAAVGVATVTYFEPAIGATETDPVPIFNMTPRAGEPARFGFKVQGIISAFLDASIRTGGDYGVTVSSTNITQAAWLTGVKLTFWGVPAAPSHDRSRGWECLWELGSCPSTAPTNPPPFLVMPTSCPRLGYVSTVRGDSWAAPGKPAETAEPLPYRLPAAIDGCDRLSFSPQVRMTPDSAAASTSTGLNVDVHVPQDAVLNAESLAESSVKDITVAFPQGVAVNPAGGDGLQACSEGQVGFTGFRDLASLPGSATATFTERLPSPLLAGENFCPDAAKIGTMKIRTPLLPHELEGAVYIASQNANPFGSLMAVYLVAEDPVSGTLVKLAGEVGLSETGQLTATVQNSPQTPFEDAEMHFFGGERAPLATPARCGSYTTDATFVPWSANQPVLASSTFDIASGPNGSACPASTLPFGPSLTGGTTNINAGSFSSLSTTIGREDGQQNMRSVQLHMPPGLSGLLANVKLCPEQQANEGTCGPESLIGETTVSAGIGSDPVTVRGGRVYLTEKYDGAPFGLSIVNPVKAGPFDLEHDTSKPSQQPPCDCVVVRARIDVDPHTAALTVTTDPSGPHAIPQIIDGVPVQIKKVNVLVDRERFTFNPTNCSPLSISASVTGYEGANEAVSVPFQIANCANLAFEPTFAVSTSGRTSKAGGASLAVKVTYPKGSLGRQANIAKVKVDLPRQLPSRLTTLQKACTAAVFDANPANCPAPSIVGHAKVVTPLLPVALEGPAYFVSHGGEAFPSLIMVLQGYGVTVDLVGATFIKKGITSSTFNATPDVPFDSFELTLPRGRYSALAANANLCRTTLNMPTLIVAQNGAQIRQTTRIAVKGCHKHRRGRRKAKRRRTTRRKG